MGPIKLNFINHSNNINNSNIIIFQKNIAEDFGEIAIAWKVIKNCGQSDNHPFKYPLEFSICASDSWGNSTPLMTSTPGQAYEMVKDSSGDILQLSSTPAASPDEVDIKNNLIQGSISANIYRDGKLLAQKTNIAPGQKASFKFNPKIYIGAISQIEEGEVLSAAILQGVNTELNLSGISSADIVMTGGGPGKGSTAFNFSLKNINR